ncbi:amidase [Pseudomonas sp. S 311-6]|nr:amidase [Pseudomonas sp. S 311-6]
MIWDSDAATLAQAYASGRRDPVEMVEAVLPAMADQPAVFLDAFAERARREAMASRARWRAGAPLSVLDGVPVAWKDMFDVRGHRTTGASATRMQCQPAAQDAAVVRRLTQAGLVNVGKTNLSEFAYSGLGLNPHFGTPVLPRAGLADRAPGGSSAGSAIAVAAGIVPLAMGTDTAGSIRVPAAFNGLLGWRASCARYDLQGVMPLAPSLDTIGPLARSARDLATLDALLRGDVAPALAPASLSALRLVVDPAILQAPVVSAAVQAQTEQCLQRLARAGVAVETRRVAAWHEAWRIQDEYGWLGGFEAFALHQPLLDSPAAAQLDVRVRARLEQTRAQPAVAVVHAYQAQARLQAAMAAELDGALLLTPTTAHVAPPLAALENDPAEFARCNLATLRLTMPGSYLDMPGVSLPSGQDAQGLPTGVLLSGPCGADTQVLRAALAVAQVLTN